MTDVFCIGLMVCDLIFSPVREDIMFSDSVSPDHYQIMPGGDALNAAINMSRLGLKVRLAGCVGCDPLADFLTLKASESGVDISGINRLPEYPTSTSVVLVDECGERHFLYYGKANHALVIDMIEPSQLSDTRIVHVGSAMALDGLDGDGLARLFHAAKSAGAITSLDVTWDRTGRWIDKIENALPYTDIFLPSLKEAQLLSGETDVLEIADFMRKRSVGCLAVKMGEQGCYVTDFKEKHHVPAFTGVKVVDATGAGDAFVSGFLTGYCRGFDLYRRALLGNAMGALCVMKTGATGGAKNYDEVVSFIRRTGLE